MRPEGTYVPNVRAAHLVTRVGAGGFEPPTFRSQSGRAARLRHAPSTQVYVRAVRGPSLGYAMVAIAATLFAVNAPVVKVIEHTGFTAERLTEVRSTGAVVGFWAIVLASRPQTLRITRRQLALVASIGVGGLALVQWSYFFAIHRLPIGEALLIQYLAPLLVALWARFAFHERVRERVWVALALSLTGLVLIVELWRGELDGVGIAVSGVACLSYAFYLLAAERGTQTRDPVSLLAWAFVFAALFWAIAQPWWSFPAHRLAGSTSLLGHVNHFHAPIWVLVLWMIVFGSIVPFLLVVAALPRIGATRTAIVAMLEPVVAILVAWAWLGEALNPVQLVGAALTLAGIGLAQTAR